MCLGVFIVRYRCCHVGNAHSIIAYNYIFLREYMPDKPSDWASQPVHLDLRTTADMENAEMSCQRSWSLSFPGESLVKAAEGQQAVKERLTLCADSFRDINQLPQSYKSTPSTPALITLYLGAWAAFLSPNQDMAISYWFQLVQGQVRWPFTQHRALT